MTVVSQRSLYGGGKCGEGEGASPPLGPGHPLRSLRSRVPLASRRGRAITRVAPAGSVDAVV